MALQTPQQEGVIALTAIISIFVAFPLVIALARVIWKRTSEPPRPRALESDQVMRRLEQLQQTVEAMAIEVERISEGQRFVTKIMSERDKQALGAGRDSDNT
jgi:hypothetical protein